MPHVPCVGDSTFPRFVLQVLGTTLSPQRKTAPRTILIRSVYCATLDTGLYAGLRTFDTASVRNILSVSEGLILRVLGCTK